MRRILQCNIRGEKVLGHPRPGTGSHGVNCDAVTRQLLGCNLGKTCDTSLGCAVVTLARIRIQSRDRGRVDDASVVRLATVRSLTPVGCSEVRRSERPFQVHADHGIPLVFCHREQHAIPQNSCIVHQHVQTSENINRLRDNTFGTVESADVIGVSNRMTSSGDDFVDYGLRRTDVASAPILCRSNIVHNDRRTRTCESEGILTPDTSSATRNDTGSILAYPIIHSAILCDPYLSGKSRTVMTPLIPTRCTI